MVLERACFFAYLLFLVLFPLAMGGREIWAQPVALGWCGGVLAGLLLAGALRGRQIFRWHWSYLFFLVPLAYAGLQLWPSATVTRWLAPETFQAWNALHGLGLDAVAARLSLAPVETWRQVLFFLLLGLCYFLGLNLCRQRRDIFTLAAAVVASAVLDALVGFYPEFAGARPWYWYIDGATAPGTVSGTFLNHNHFACLMTMGVLMAFGLLFAILARKGYRQPRPETSAPGSPGNDRKVAESWVESAETPAYALPGALALLFVLFILVVAQALSYSRGGGISMLVLGLVFFLWWLYRGSRFQQKRHIVACLAVLVGAGYIALFEAANRLAERYALLAGGIEQLTTEGRLLIWQDALPMLKTWWLTGIGSGAFANVSPRYESGWALDMLFLHAHNDWLEALVEFGLPMAGSLMIALLVWLAIQGRRLQRQADSRLRWLGLGALFAIVAVLLHELVDFNLQAPAVATVFVALLVVLVRCGQEGTRHKAQEDGVTGLRGYGATGNSLEAPKGRGTLGTPSPSSASGAEQGTGLRTQDPGPSGQAKSGSPISNPQSPIPAPQAPEGGIQNLLTPTLTPTPAPQALSRYGSSLALVGISSSQAKIGRTGTVQVTQTWLCTGDIDRDYAIVTRYRQGDQILFSDRFALVALATAETPMVSWRVGELIPLTRTITPISMAARARNRIENGKIDAEVVLQPLAPGHTPPAANPPARIPLFVVGE